MRGNQDGVATKAEVKALKAEHTEGRWSLEAEKRAVADGFSELAGATAAGDVQTLAPEMQKLPAALRSLALELDHLWGNSDGHVSAAELDKVARFTLAALPFFTPEASEILALADQLGYTTEKAPVANVLNLRLALSNIPKDDASGNARFRELLDEAITEGETVGVPELLRDATRHAPRYHSLSVLEHSAYAVKSISALSEVAGLGFPAGAATMLLHDVGKIIDRTLWTHDDGSLDGYSFKQHEAEGAAWLKARGLDPAMIFHVTHHGVYRTMSADEIRTLCPDKETLAQAMIVYLADSLAKGNEPALVESFALERPKITELLIDAGLDADVLLSTYEHFRESWYAEKS